MAEIILGVLCVLVGLFAAGLALLSLWANAMGGATNRAAVNLVPTAICALVAIVAIV